MWKDKRKSSTPQNLMLNIVLTAQVTMIIVAKQIDFTNVLFPFYFRINAVLTNTAVWDTALIFPSVESRRLRAAPDHLAQVCGGGI